MENGVAAYEEPGTKGYLLANSDVRDAIERGEIVSAFAHWLEFGQSEGRAWPVAEASVKGEPQVVVDIADRIETRIQYLAHGIDRATHEGIEIGALNWPVFSHSEVNVKYVDFASKEELKRSGYASDRSKIVDVDYIWSGFGSLAASVGASECFDFAIASHVIEHVPNVLGWLRRIAEVLRLGGVFNLAIPDRRFTFDLRRRETSLAEWVEADLLDFATPSPRQIFDHLSQVRHVAPGEPWQMSKSGVDYAPMLGAERERVALEKMQQAMQTGRYLDIHCSVFTPATFMELFAGATRLGLINLCIDRLLATSPNSFEFYVSLRKPEMYSRLDLISHADRARDMLAAINRTAALQAGP